MRRSELSETYYSSIYKTNLTFKYPGKMYNMVSHVIDSLTLRLKRINK